MGECVENTVSQCSFETRVGSTGEEEQVEVCRDIPIEDCQLVKEEKCIDGELEEVEECNEKEVEECEIVPHEECHQVTVELPKLRDKQVQQIVCDQENEIGDATTTEKVAQQETDDNDVLENNYDEILDAVNTIFGSGITEDVNGGEAKEIVTSTEAELVTTEEPAPTTTVLPSVPTTTTTTTTTTAPATTTEAATTTTDATTTTESVTIVDIATEAVTSTAVSSGVPTEPKTDDSKIHFRDDGPVRDFTRRIFVDDGLVDARRKAIEARRKAASDASRIFFPTEEEGGASIPS